MKIKFLRLTLFITASTLAFILLDFASHRLVLDGVLLLRMNYQSNSPYKKDIQRIHPGESHAITWPDEYADVGHRSQIRLGVSKSDFHSRVEEANPPRVLLKRPEIQSRPQKIKESKNESIIAKVDKIVQESVSDGKGIMAERLLSPRNGTRALQKTESNKEFIELGDRHVDAPRQVKGGGEEKFQRFADRYSTVRQGLEEELLLERHVDEAWLQKRSTEFSRRREVVERVCGSASEGQETNGGNVEHMEASNPLMKPPNLKHFLLVRSKSSLTCPINKVASTSMALGLLKAENLQHKIRLNNYTSPHFLVASLHPTSELELSLARKYFFKFLIVRHPFERLLSAYRDKVVKAQDNSLLAFRTDISECMKQLREENITNALLSSPHMESSQEREYRLGKIRENHRNIENETRKGRPYDRDDLNIPSFNDFLQYVLYCDTHSSFASHWLPYWSWCSPCQIKYDVIAKLETAAEDFKFLWHRLGLLTKQQVPWQNSSTDKQESSRWRNLAKYYSTLDPKTIHEVFQRYWPDFKLFEYDIRDVLRIGGHCTWRGETLC